MMKKILALIIILSAYSLNAHDLKIFSEEKYLDNNPSAEKTEIVRYLKEQFKNIRTSQADIDKLWFKQEVGLVHKMARFQIIDQKLYADSYLLAYYYFPMLIEYFQYLIKNYKVPDVDFIIYMVEQIQNQDKFSSEMLDAPGFIMFQGKNKLNEMNKLIFPDAYFLKKDWGELLTKIKNSRQIIKWEDKINKVFWRGGTTGGDYNISQISGIPRMQLVMQSKIFPEIIDAKFAGYMKQVTQDKNGHQFLEMLKYLNLVENKRVDELDHLKFKYLLSIDGNAATGTRLPWIMASDSVLLRQLSNKIQWYYSALKPWKHFVPVNEDLTDILEQHEWMEKNPKELEDIIRNGNNFVEENLTPDDIDAHVLILLNEYSKIQQDTNIKPSLPKAEEIMEMKYLLNNLWQWIKIKAKWSFGK